MTSRLSLRKLWEMDTWNYENLVLASGKPTPLMWRKAILTEFTYSLQIRKRNLTLANEGVPFARPDSFYMNETALKILLLPFLPNLRIVVAFSFVATRP